MNADDFGLTHGVNQAIAELHRAGVVTSASLMARERATDEAIEIARSTPSLGVGCHLVLVDGEPVLPGGFQLKMSAFLRQVITGRIDGAAIEAEAGAQIELLKSRGVNLTHIDSHKHTHMFPFALRPLLRAAKKAGIHAVRNPFEPAWSQRATPAAPWFRRNAVGLLRRLEPTFRRIVAEEGFTTTDGNLGITATGTLDSKALGSLFESDAAGHLGAGDASWLQRRRPGEGRNAAACLAQR